MVFLLKLVAVHTAETGAQLLRGPQHRHSLGFARFFGPTSCNTIRHTRRNAFVGATQPRDGEGAAPGRGELSPTPLPGLARHAQPGPILYTLRVSKMTVAPMSALPSYARPGGLFSAFNRMAAGGTLYIRLTLAEPKF